MATAASCHRDVSPDRRRPSLPNHALTPTAAAISTAEGPNPATSASEDPNRATFAWADSTPEPGAAEPAGGPAAGPLLRNLPLRVLIPRPSNDRHTWNDGRHRSNRRDHGRGVRHGYDGRWNGSSGRRGRRGRNGRRSRGCWSRNGGDGNGGGGGRRGGWSFDVHRARRRLRLRCLLDNRDRSWDGLLRRGRWSGHGGRRDGRLCGDDDGFTRGRSLIDRRTDAHRQGNHERAHSDDEDSRHRATDQKRLSRWPAGRSNYRHGRCGVGEQVLVVRVDLAVGQRV